MADRNLTLKEFWALPEEERYERYKTYRNTIKWGFVRGWILAL